MPLSVRAALRAFTLREGDTVILNDPYRGGTHLPDITLVTPVFVKKSRRPAFYVANRAHHADVGGQAPGSMPLARHLEEEGVVIPPTLFQKRGRIERSFLRAFLAQVRHPTESQADLRAQLSANQVGATRMHELIAGEGLGKIQAAMAAHRRYEERITREALARLRRGVYSFEDVLDDDGLSDQPVKIAVQIRVRKSQVEVDFTGCAKQVPGPVNATFAITLSCVAYAFRCVVLALTGEDCLSLKPFRLKTRKGSVVDARYPAPVAGGNVETSQRLVDVLFGALAKALPALIPAASQGTMNNVALGSERYSYYETLGGGMGALPDRDGPSAIHSHMTNTMNTPIEAIENELPLRVTSYRIRRGSGGSGRFRGGDGLIREYEFLEPAHISLLTERRSFRPYGLKGGKPGMAGVNWLLKPVPLYPRPPIKIRLPGKVELNAQPGDILRIETPGGGGFSSPRP
jgi:N-methylhydantoinase B